MNYKVSEPIKYERKFVSAHRTNVEWGLHIHRHIEIVLVTDGVLRMQISNDVVDIPKGYAAFAESFVLGISWSWSFLPAAWDMGL